jgi:hypothetical protein
LFLGIFEKDNFTPELLAFLPFIKRYIDDGFVIWKHHPDPITDQKYWILIQPTMNSCGVSWAFSERSRKATFLGMDLWIEKGKVLTALRTKPLNRHLYIPPSSCHSPGVFKGLLFGHIQRISILCSMK